MSDDGSPPEFYWCIKHRRVETDGELCPARDRLGPYPDRGSAERAFETVALRNDAWEVENERWEGER